MTRYLGFLLVASTVPATSAAVIYSNDFSSAGTTGLSGVNGTAIAVSGGQLTATNSTGITRTSLSFSTVSLNVGDSLTLSADVQVTSAVSSSVRRLYVGLWDATADQGYMAWAPATTAASQSDAIGYSTAFPTTSNLSGTSVVSGSDYLGSSTSYVHNVTFTLTRTDLGLNLAYAFINDSGVTKTLSSSITTNLFYTFDHFDVSTWGNNNFNFNLDNVVLTYTPVPEPSSYGLLGAGVLAAGAFVRRRSKRL